VCSSSSSGTPTGSGNHCRCRMKSCGLWSLWGSYIPTGRDVLFVCATHCASRCSTSEWDSPPSW
jgi:hypothetical protein